MYVGTYHICPFCQFAALVLAGTVTIGLFVLCCLAGILHACLKVGCTLGWRVSRKPHDIAN